MSLVLVDGWGNHRVALIDTWAHNALIWCSMGKMCCKRVDALKTQELCENTNKCNRIMLQK